MATSNDFFSEAMTAISGPLGGDVRTVVLIGISICLVIMGLRFVLGLLGVDLPQRKENDDDD